MTSLTKLLASALLLSACTPAVTTTNGSDGQTQGAVSSADAITIAATCTFARADGQSMCGLVTIPGHESTTLTVASIDPADGYDVKLASGDTTGFMVLAKYGDGRISGDLFGCLGHPTRVYSNGGEAAVYTLAPGASNAEAHRLDEDCNVRGIAGLYLAAMPSTAGEPVTGVASGRTFVTGSLGDACSALDPCYDGFACTDSICQLRHGPLGAACVSATDCMPGLTCNDGACAALQGGACTTTTDCASVLQCDAASQTCQLPPTSASGE